MEIATTMYHEQVKIDQFVTYLQPGPVNVIAA